MTVGRTAAALLTALLLGGCAAFGGAPGAQAPADGRATPAPTTAAAPESAASAAAAAQRIGVEIDAAPALKTLLERSLDLVRLGRLARDDIDDSEWSRLVDATPAQARELLQTEGYFASRVTLERLAASAPGGHGDVRLHVEPGPRARISRVTLEAEGALEHGAAAGDAYARATLEAWRKAWPLSAGQGFSNPAWSEAKAAALARLRAAGYATASWVGTGAEVDVQHGAVRLFLVVDSGPLFRYGELRIEGLAAHEEQTVSNLMGAPRGAPVTEALLLDFQDRLQKSGLFENINVTLDPDPAHADAARVTARLNEAPLQTWTLGVGVSSNTGPRATVEHVYRRVFGYALTAQNKIEYGKLHKLWNGELSTHPLEGLYRNLLGGAVEQLVSDTDTVLSQRARVGRAQDAQRVERLYYLEAERSLRHTDDNVVNSKAIAVSLNYHGVWRELDSVVLPTRGFSFNGQVGIGHSHGKDAVPGTFERVYARLTGYLPIGSSWYGQARVEAGQVFLHSNMVVPESQQFRAGGDESVRGYSYRSLGPIVDGAVGSGNVLYTTSIELARPIARSLPSVWGAVFVDAGNAGNRFAGLDPAVGVGFGVRWRSPAGPLRVDIAYGKQTHRTRLHFSVGIAF